MARTPRDPATLAQILETLARTGPAGSAELCVRLGVSQPTFSRRVRAAGDQLLVTGRGRATRYAIPRPIEGVAAPIPVYEVRPPPELPVHLLDLHPVAPDGFLAIDRIGSAAQPFADLPWFLDGLRPAGFLGRLIPRRHPDLRLPADIRVWSAAQVLRYATRHGWDLPGALIVGADAYGRYLEQIDHPQNEVDEGEADRVYPQVAEDLLSLGGAGSSAAGEQPKFLATRRSGDVLVPVLVKFSSPVGSPEARRTADLLTAEHLALETLREHGVGAAVTRLRSAGGRTFLESERFDRVGMRHRVGQVTLAALDAHFVGSDQSSWTSSVDQLVRQRLVDTSVLRTVRLVELFGRLIGNSDMHFGNLAFLLDGTRPTSLAPIYDMLPMHYYPRHGELPKTDFHLPELTPAWSEVATDAIDASSELWQRIAHETRISKAFRDIAEGNLPRVEALRSIAAHLPRPPKRAGP